MNAGCYGGSHPTHRMSAKTTLILTLLVSLLFATQAPLRSERSAQGCAKCVMACCADKGLYRSSGWT